MKRLLALFLVVVLGFTTAGSVLAQDATPEAAGESVKIGVLNPTTGSFAVFGEMVNAGIEMYFAEVDGMAGDLSVELVFADTAGDPQQALDQARRLIGEENVDLLMGIVNSAVVPSLAELAAQEEIPLVITIGGAQVATGPDRSEFVFRTALVNGQQDRVVGWYAATELGLSQAATFAWDFLVGQERVAGFTETFTGGGGTIVTEQKPPLGTTDYGPFISQVDPSSIDSAYAFFAGPGALAFSQQMADFGYTPDVQVLASDYFTAGVLGEMGTTVIGLVQAGGYTSSIDTPENAAYVEAYMGGNDRPPGVYDVEGYVGAMVVADAIARAGSADTGALLEALAATDLMTPAGPIVFDEQGQAVRTIYVTRVDETDDGVVQTIVEEIPEVDQNWTPE